MDEVVGLYDEMISEVAEQGVDPPAEGSGSGPRPGEAVGVAEGEREETASVGRKVEYHRGAEIVGEHHASLVEEGRCDDEVPGTVWVVDDCLETWMTESVPVCVQYGLPALGHVVEHRPKVRTDQQHVRHEVLLKGAKQRVVHDELVHSVRNVGEVVACDESDLQGVPWENYQIF